MTPTRTTKHTAAITQAKRRSDSQGVRMSAKEDK